MEVRTWPVIRRLWPLPKLEVPAEVPVLPQVIVIPRSHAKLVCQLHDSFTRARKEGLGIVTAKYELWQAIEDAVPACVGKAAEIVFHDNINPAVKFADSNESIGTK